MIKLTARNKDKAGDKICILWEYPPYNNWRNICYGGGWVIWEAGLKSPVFSIS